MYVETSAKYVKPASIGSLAIGLASGEETQLVARSPESHLNLPDHLQKRNDDAHALLNAALSNRYAGRDFVLMSLLFRHGLTVRNLIALRAENVAGARLLLPTGNGSRSTVQLHHSILDVLWKREIPLLGVSDLLLRSQLGGGLKRQAINYLLETTSSKAGIRPFSPTELRHLCGFNLAAAGSTVHELTQAFGLSEKSCVSRYFGTDSAQDAH
jgi:site-specific recombinase XerD